MFLGDFGALNWFFLKMELAIKRQNKWCHFDHRRRQHHQCRNSQTDTVVLQESRNKTNDSPNMAPTYYSKISPIIPTFVFFLLVTSSVFPVHSYGFNQANQTFRPTQASQKLQMIKAHLEKINKPSTKTIQVGSFFSKILAKSVF